jgi:hypothetical protein
VGHHNLLAGDFGVDRLPDILNEMHLAGDIDLGGRWVRVHGRSCCFYVVELSWSRGYCVWCDHPAERAVEVFQDAHDAFDSGIRRSSAPRTLPPPPHAAA